MIVQQPIVVDTCVLINLLATEKLTEISSLVAPSLLVCTQVAAESIYLRSLNPTQQPEQVYLNPLFLSGLLTPCDFANDVEEQLFINYALELDDGEAMTLAIAHARNLPLATDEKKAKRVINKNAGHLRVLSTAEILHNWARGKDQSEVRLVLEMIGIRARFRPPDNSDPFSAWWNSII